MEPVMTYLEKHCSEIQRVLDQRNVHTRFSFGVMSDHAHGNIFLQMMMDSLGKKSIVMDFQQLKKVYGIKVSGVACFQKLLTIMREHIHEEIQGEKPENCVIIFKNIEAVAKKYMTAMTHFISQGYRTTDAEGNEYYLPVFLTSGKDFSNLAYYFTQRGTMYLPGWQIENNKALIANLAVATKKLNSFRKTIKPMLPENVEGDNLLIFYRNYLRSLNPVTVKQVSPIHTEHTEAEKLAA
jgi:hypothetical protein